MGLSWDEFLKLATVISNLNDAIYNDKFQKKNRRVFEVANDYLKFLDDLKYMHFMEEFRESSTKIL